MRRGLDMNVNRYPGKCNGQCDSRVEAGKGFTTIVEGRYKLWCAACVPERKAPTASAPRVRVLTTDGKIIMPYEPENIPLVRSLPGAKWDKDNKWWSVSLAPCDRARVLEVADRIGLEVPSSLRSLQRSAQADSACGKGLYPFQVDGVDFLSSRTKGLLGDEMGLGKSVQSLMAIPQGGSALVVCRAGLKYNWLDEATRWRPDLTPTVLEGRGSFRWPKPGEVVIINSDILPDDYNTPSKGRTEGMQAFWVRLAEYRRLLREANPQAASVCLIVDEAHDYKNRKAARTRKVKELSSLCAKTMALTGSPLTNRPEDLFGVLDTVGLAKTVFGSYERFQGLFNAVHNGYGVEYGKPKPEVPELLRRVMLRRLRSEVLPDLPSKTYTNLVVGTSDRSLQRKLDELWENWQDTLAVDVLPPFEAFASVRAELAKSRIPAMLEYIENAEEQECPLVVFSSHLAPLNALVAREGWALITGDTPAEKRQEIVRSFQAGNLKGVGITIRAGGVGLTLTHAWKVLFVDLDWTPAANWQAEDRVARIGQTSNKVEIVRMVSDHALDLHVQRMLVDKIDTINRSIDLSMEGVKRTAPRVGEDVAGGGETEEQFQQRMDRLEDERRHRERESAKGRVSVIHWRESAKLKGGLPELDEARADAVRRAFRFMLGECDGAFLRDGQGFNKPDAALAHIVLTAGLETQEELEVAYCLLSRYRRQLSAFPGLFSQAVGSA